MLSVAAVTGLALPSSSAGAAPKAPMPTFKQLLAQATALAEQVSAMGQQYDALQIQYESARAQVKAAKATVRQDEALLISDERALSQVAVATYVTGGPANPALELLQSSHPEAMLDRSTILGQLQRQNTTKVRQVRVAQVAAQRAKLAAAQLQQQAASVAKAMATSTVPTAFTVPS
jgi:hypothetical protein